MFRAAAAAGFVNREKAEDAARVENAPALGVRAGNVCPVESRCVQREVSPAKATVRGLVAWIAGRREIESLKTIDKAIFQDGEQVINLRR